MIQWEVDSFGLCLYIGSAAPVVGRIGLGRPTFEDQMPFDAASDSEVATDGRSAYVIGSGGKSPEETRVFCTRSMRAGPA